MSPLLPAHAAMPNLVSSLPQIFTLFREETESTCPDSCLTKWKTIFALVLLVEGLLFGQVVFLLKKFTTRASSAASGSSKFSVAVHFGNALSAGVLLATGMLHILPETIELLSGAGPHGSEADTETHHEEGGGSLEEHGGQGHHEGHAAVFPWAYFIVMISFYALFVLEKIVVPKFLGGNCCTTYQQKGEQDAEQGSVSDTSSMTSDSVSLEKQRDTVAESATLEGAEEARGFQSKEFVGGLIQILALSAHSLFESMALGNSGEFTTVFNIFIATAAHRWLTAMSISFKLVRKLRYLPFLVLLTLFSSMVPLGIGVGSALTSLPAQAQGVLFGISAGTFLYIGAFEGMADEFVQHKKWVVRKFLSTLGGVAIISITTAMLVVFDIHG